MKVYIAIRFWTPNELGGLGSLTDCEVFKTEEEAVEYVRQESGGKEPEKEEGYFFVSVFSILFYRMGR